MRGEKKQLRGALGVVPILLLDLANAVLPWRPGASLDPLTVTCPVDRSFVTVERLLVAVAARGSMPETRVDEVAGRPADVVRSVKASRFPNYLLETLLAS